VISGGGWECVAHLGAYGSLAERAPELSLAQCPDTFAAGAGETRFALVGGIERDNARANLLFSARSSIPPLLTEDPLLAAFAERRGC
jgi:hypothetical protein